MSKEWEAVTRLGLRNVCKIPWSNSTKGKSDKRNHKSGTSNNVERIPSNGTRHLGVATWPFQRHSRSNHQATRKKEKTKSSDGLSLLLFHVCRWNFSITTVGIFSLIPKATRRRKLVEERRLSKNSMGTFFFKSENLGKRRNACVCANFRGEFTRPSPAVISNVGKSSNCYAHSIERKQNDKTHSSASLLPVRDTI